MLFKKLHFFCVAFFDKSRQLYVRICIFKRKLRNRSTADQKVHYPFESTFQVHTFYYIDFQSIISVCPTSK